MSLKWAGRSAFDSQRPAYAIAYFFGCVLGAVLGFDDGTVHRLYEDGRMEHVLETGYGVFTCLEHRSASSPVPGFTSTARKMNSHGKWSIRDASVDGHERAP